MNRIQSVQARIDASRQARPTVPAPAYAACRAAALRAQIAHEALVEAREAASRQAAPASGDWEVEP